MKIVALNVVTNERIVDTLVSQVEADRVNSEFADANLPEEQVITFVDLEGDRFSVRKGAVESVGVEVRDIPSDSDEMVLAERRAVTAYLRQRARSERASEAFYSMEVALVLFEAAEIIEQGGHREAS